MSQFRILISYWYFKDRNIDEWMAKYFTPPYPDVFADSGAFSAYSLGGSVDLGAYAEWLHRWKHHFTCYANLDVKGNVAAGLKNLQRLEDKGLHPLPVFHGGEPFSVLEDMVTRYPYIALGGLAASGAGHNAMLGFMVRCFKIAQGKSVFHGFGMTAWKLLKALPWYSVDSSSWGQGFRFGAVPMFDPLRGKWYKCGLGDRKAWYSIASLVRSYGYDPEDFADRKRYDRGKTCGLTAIQYAEAERFLRRRHGIVTIPGQPNNEGLRIYLADTNLQNFQAAQMGYHQYTAEQGRAQP